MTLFGRTLAALSIVALLFAITACATTPSSQTAPSKADSDQTDKIEEATMATVSAAKPLQVKYSRIAFRTFSGSGNIAADYPDALSALEMAMLTHLRQKNVYEEVAESAKPPFAASTLLVDANIDDMRIASSAARFWGGAFAGSSFMEVRIRLVDAASGRLVHEKVLSTSNNAFAASWNMGSSDQSLPMDMGKIVGEYIFTVIPAK